MKKILGLSIAFMLLLGIAGIGSWAYFTDTEGSTGNTLVAGTLDLKTDDVDGVTQTLLATNMKRGDVAGPGTITLKNVGDLAGSILDLAFAYTESDGSPNSVNMSADATAATLEVTTLNYGGSSLLGSVSDGNSNLYIDIEDLKNADLSGLSGIAAGASKVFEITVQLSATTSNDFQGDGVDVTMTFILIQ